MFKSIEAFYVSEPKPREQLQKETPKPSQFNGISQICVTGLPEGRTFRESCVSSVISSDMTSPALSAVKHRVYMALVIYGLAKQK